MKEFKTAKMDQRTLISTLIFGGICVVAIFALLIKLINEKVYMVMIPLAILVAAMAASYLLIPKLFIDHGKKILIKNSFANIEIDRRDIKIIEKSDVLKFNLRTFGVGGIFGNFGYFNGNEVWYVTNIFKKIKITMNSGKIYMISPENRDEFLQTLNL